MPGEVSVFFDNFVFIGKLCKHSVAPLQDAPLSAVPLDTLNAAHMRHERVSQTTYFYNLLL